MRNKKHKRIEGIFEDIYNKLPTTLPLILKFRNKIKIEDSKSADGLCEIDENDVITISLRKKASESSLLDTLIHEYAHALMFDKNKIDEKNFHSDEWGKYYSKVYRVVHEED